MNFRVVAGIVALLAVLASLPVLALPDIGAFTPVPSARAGTVWVSLADINGTVAPENVAVAYAMGDVFELPASAISEDRATDIVTVGLGGSNPARQFTLIQKTGTADARYLIHSVTVARKSEPLLVNDQSFAIVPATANYYMDTVPEGKQHEWIDLDWKNPQKDLNLTVYSPDASFGPYSDIADGRKDGRIFLDISSLLNVTAGNWFFRVQNNNPEYIPYLLNTYSA